MSDEIPFIRHALKNRSVQYMPFRAFLIPKAAGYTQSVIPFYTQSSAQSFGYKSSFITSTQI